MATKSTPPAGEEKYEAVRLLNTGSSGFVQLAREKTTNELVAIKHIERGSRINRNVLREILNHRNLLHHHVIQFKEVFLTNDYLCIVMEYAAGGDLMEYMKKKNGLTEDEARWFFQQLILGLDYCHKMGVINRDIKLENTLIDRSPWPVLKICDFGFSKHEKLNSGPDSRVGTPAYLAPEVVTSTRGTTYDGKIADIWSCGVFLYVMLVGAYPFERPEDKGYTYEDKIKKIMSRIVHLDYTVPPYVKISDKGRDLLDNILAHDPRKRITMEGILEHPWFNKNLPGGAKEMNATLCQQNSGLQSIEVIVEILTRGGSREGEVEEEHLSEELL